MNLKAASKKAKKLGFSWIAMNTVGDWYGFNSEPQLCNQADDMFKTWDGKDATEIGSATMTEWPKQSVLASKTRLTEVNPSFILVM